MEKKITKSKNNSYQTEAALLRSVHSGQDQAIDEAMVKFKGRSSLKQYIPNKPIKRGFKMWMRADSKSGYVCEFEVYEGKKGDKVEKGLGAQAVMALTEHIHGRYHHVYCDNFFTGVDLFLDLLRKQTYAWGTIRPHRRGFPSDFKPLLKKGLLNREDSRTVQNGYLTVSIWQDTKPICQ